MSGELLYLDSSALVKLVLPEAESAALLESLAAWPACVTSELAIWPRRCLSVTILERS